MNISEVAAQLEIPASTIRYYEQIELLHPVPRNEAGVRQFTVDDVNWLNLVKCLRDVGLPIEVLKKYVTLVEDGDSTVEERVNILVTERERLIEKRSELDKVIGMLDTKVDNYDNHMLKAERHVMGEV